MKQSNSKIRTEEAEQAVEKIASVTLDEVEEAAPESMFEKLSKKETDELAKQEATIKKNQAGYWDWVAAYEAIHRGRLYKSTHTSFEAYCNERWGLERSHANRLIKASRCHEALKNCPQFGDTQLPASEAIIRPLTKLSPDKFEEAWQAVLEIADGGPVTMKLVEAVADEILPAKEKKTKATVTAAVEVVREETPEEEITRLLRRLRELPSETPDAKVKEALNQLALHYGVEMTEPVVSAATKQMKSKQ